MSGSTNRLMRRLLCITLLFQLLACSVAPSRDILPYPEHIRAGVQVGDSVRVVTSDGETVDMTVSAITSDSLESAERNIRFENVEAISKKSFRLVKNPCDTGQPLGCSIPVAITVFSDYYAGYAAEFREPCISHDFCYAFGLRTYGHDRTGCDQAFFEDMQTLCIDRHGFDIVERADCLLAAEQLHAAVQGFGDERFHRESSQYCEYAGPP